MRGGRPGVLKMETELAAKLFREYLETILGNDIHEIDEIRRDERKMRMLLKSLARNESTTVSNNALVRDKSDMDDEPISRQTLSEYMDILRRLFIIEEHPAFDPNLRSSVRVGKSPKRRFINPSPAIASFGVTSDIPMKDLNIFGFMFESLCIRDYQEIRNRRSLPHSV